MLALAGRGAVSDPWAPLLAASGLPFWCDGKERRLRSLSVTGTSPGTLPIWIADVDGCMGCGGTLDAALVLAARAAGEGSAS